MTTEPAVTGSLISKEQAVELTAEIRRACVEFVELRDHLQDLIRQAHAGQVHNALGYASWPAWFADTVKITPADKAARQLWVAFMSGEGMSQRAIGQSLGVDQKTVSNDLRSGEENSSPDNVIGLDGKRYNPKRRQPIKPEVPPGNPTSDLITLGRQVVSAVDKAAKLLHSFYDHPEYRARGAMDLDVDTALHHLATVAQPDPQESAKFDQYKAQCDANVAAFKAKLESEAQQARALRDDERRRYQEGIEVYRAKGLITPSDYTTILSCLHPDSRNSVSDEKLAAAFRLFNDSRLQTLLVKKRPTPRSTPSPRLPTRVADLKRKTPRR
jgi:hypothetical protein